MEALMAEVLVGAGGGGTAGGGQQARSARKETWKMASAPTQEGGMMRR